jgi:hypothetical protein
VRDAAGHLAQRTQAFLLNDRMFDLAQLRVGRASLVFGAPWWDHYVPLRLLARGSELVFAAQPVAFHLRHQQRWNWDLWRDMGERFIEEIRPALPPQDDPAGEAVRQYARALERALEPGPAGRVADAVRTIVGRARTDGRYWTLQRVSAANIAFLDAVRRRP